MSEHVDALDPAQLNEARAWAEEQGYVSLLGDEVVAPGDMTDEEVLGLLDRQHPGGAAAFACPADDGHVSMEPHGQWAT